MNLTRQDWIRLALPLLALLVAIIFAIGMVSYAQTYSHDLDQKRQQQEQQLMQARSRLQSSGQERDSIIKYLPIYQRLIQQGFIGEERRIEWVDALRNIHQREHLFGIRYSIGAQAPYSLSYIANPAPFSLYRSVMTLELPMLHEGDILLLLDQLRQTQPAAFLPRDCIITRNGILTVPLSLTPTLNAACELDWLSLRESENGVKP
ncbi:hypothetical protein [Methylobacillus glycogenes]|uniref:hypothetical protein n=1 Tax=Methylobacillus glycogenes TaxID=406 RepID=UPI000470818C|nr:hypothetical protein [Methylobacillus glycogenes]